MGRLLDLDFVDEESGRMVVEQYKGKVRTFLPQMAESYKRGLQNYISDINKQRRASVKILAHLLAMRDVDLKARYKEVMAEVARKRTEYLRMLLPEIAGKEKVTVTAVAK